MNTKVSYNEIMDYAASFPTSEMCFSDIKDKVKAFKDDTETFINSMFNLYENDKHALLVAGLKLEVKLSSSVTGEIIHAQIGTDEFVETVKKKAEADGVNLDED